MTNEYPAALEVQIRSLTQTWTPPVFEYTDTCTASPPYKKLELLDHLTDALVDPSVTPQPGLTGDFNDPCTTCDFTILTDLTHVANVGDQFKIRYTEREFHAATEDIKTDEQT